MELDIDFLKEQYTKSNDAFEKSKRDIQRQHYVRGLTYSGAGGCLRSMGVLAWLIDRDVSRFRQMTSESMEWRLLPFELKASGQVEVDHQCVGIRCFISIPDGLAGGNFAGTLKLAALMGTDLKTEKKENHIDCVRFGYTLKAFLTGNEAGIAEWFPIAREKLAGTKTGYLAGETLIVQAILENDIDLAIYGLGLIVKYHLQQNKYCKIGAHICLDAIGYSNLCRWKGLWIPSVSPLVPEELLLDDQHIRENHAKIKKATPWQPTIVIPTGNIEKTNREIRNRLKEEKPAKPKKEAKPSTEEEVKEIERRQKDNFERNYRFVLGLIDTAIAWHEREPTNGGHLNSIATSTHDAALWAYLTGEGVQKFRFFESESVKMALEIQRLDVSCWERGVQWGSPWEQLNRVCYGFAGGHTQVALELLSMLGKKPPAKDLEKNTRETIIYFHFFKAVVLDDQAKIGEWYPQAQRFLIDHPDVKLSGEALMLKAIVEHDGKMATQGLKRKLKLWRNMKSPYCYLCDEGIGLANICRWKGLNVEAVPPLVPAELLM